MVAQIPTLEIVYMELRVYSSHLRSYSTSEITSIPAHVLGKVQV